MTNTRPHVGVELKYAEKPAKIVKDFATERQNKLGGGSNLGTAIGRVADSLNRLRLLTARLKFFSRVQHCVRRLQDHQRFPGTAAQDLLLLIGSDFKLVNVKIQIRTSLA